MGKLIKGKWWTDDDIAEVDSRSEFIREETLLRNWISKKGKFQPEKNRYHIYLAYNCPWAHRVFLYLKLKNLEDIIDVSFVAPKRTDQGWGFDPSFPDLLHSFDYLHQLYVQANKSYSGRVTVPVLWDRKTDQIVSNESSEIIRMLNSLFNELNGNNLDFYPKADRESIDSWNEYIYTNINNGVYKAGFAESQDAYEAAVISLFDALEKIDAHLSSNRYLAGTRLTEADLRLFPTLARFDIAYYGAFKCNIKRLADFPNLWNYTKQIYQITGVSETVKLNIYKKGYYSKSLKRNPLGIIPLGPTPPDFNGTHNRDNLKGTNI